MKENIPVNQQKRNEEYNEYVEQITPTYNTWKNCFHAFWIGGLICMIGEFIFAFFKEVPLYLSVSLFSI